MQVMEIMESIVTFVWLTALTFFNYVTDYVWENGEFATL